MFGLGDPCTLFADGVVPEAARTSVVTKLNWPATQWTMNSTDDAVTLTTSLLKVTVTRKDGAIAYGELNGDPLVEEAIPQADS